MVSTRWRPMNARHPNPRQDHVIAMLADCYSQAMALCEKHGAQKFDNLHQGMLQFRHRITPKTRNRVQKMNDACKLARHLTQGFCDEVLLDLSHALEEGSDNVNGPASDE